MQTTTPPHLIELPAGKPAPWPDDEPVPVGMVDEIELYAYAFHGDAAIARALGLPPRRVSIARRDRRRGLF